MLHRENLFQPVFDWFQLRAKQTRFDLFEQLLRGQQCVQFVSVEPDTRQLENTAFFGVVVLAVTVAVVHQRSIEIIPQHIDGSSNRRARAFQQFFEALMRDRQAMGS